MSGENSMRITEKFVSEILRSEYPHDFQQVYDRSLLIQYLDRKMKAVHGDSKTRRSLANIYAIYSILHFYQRDFFEMKDGYRLFEGYDYMKLFNFYRGLYCGSKLQNHALNSRVNGEFRNKFGNAVNDLIINNNGKYLIHIDYIYVDEHDISRVSCKIIEKYIELLQEKDHVLISILEGLRNLADYTEKRIRLKALLTEDTEARIFEIISYSILKNHYKNTTVFWGYAKDTISEVPLELHRTGRTNANDGGIDFVLRPIGRFFQVTEVSNYDKYLLDIDKVMHFPITFVVKRKVPKEKITAGLERYIVQRAGGIEALEERYRKAIEEIITINELQNYIEELEDKDIDEIIRDIDFYYKLEMNMDNQDEE